jgi:L-lactate dehydrogenase complex protein LldG
MLNLENNQEARSAILKSIRDHLSASTPHNAVHHDIKAALHQLHHRDGFHSPGESAPVSLVDLFKERLEAVDGTCILAAGEAEIIEALRTIVYGLRNTPLQASRIAVSDSPVVQRLARHLEHDVEELTVTPKAADLFGYDVGITAVQAAIAETGTLVLQSNHERHRLISLLPPVHIAIVESEQIYGTLGEVLGAIRSDGKELSPAITFITGPSRTADIELTLAIGVHGPQRLYVVVNTGHRLGVSD